MLRSLPDCSTLFIVFHSLTASDLSFSPALRPPRSNRKRGSFEERCPSSPFPPFRSKIGEKCEKFENLLDETGSVCRPNNNAFVKPKCRLTSSIPRIANYRQLTVYTERGTRSEFGDKKEKEEKKREQRLERSGERGRIVLQELKGFGLGGVVTMRK